MQPTRHRRLRHAMWIAAATTALLPATGLPLFPCWAIALGIALTATAAELVPVIDQAAAHDEFARQQLRVLRFCTHLSLFLGPILIALTAAAWFSNQPRHIPATAAVEAIGILSLRACAWAELRRARARRERMSRRATLLEPLVLLITFGLLIALWLSANP